ncbi:hypothetical protein PoB_000307300 [Plakobranchus ocellatus]|uniref:Galectin n=1 Tax=Plakobranchus ocellatus TaxID=259542 RepID=A0AAV3Y2U1_9GAST|nr:hypothetical protein PoB_000307300 [Plakobranchus ocellatus]
MVHMHRRKIVQDHVALLSFRWLLYHVILGSSLCKDALGSTDFVKDSDHGLICKSDLIPLMPSPASHLMCARMCKREPDCTAFMFDRQNSSFPGASTSERSGTCLWCPANDILSISFTPADPQLETWFNVRGFLVSLPTKDELVPIRDVLATVGRSVIVQGRVPEPVPRRCRFTLYVNDTESFAVRVSPHFHFHGYINKLFVNSKIENQWDTHIFPDNPFSAGRNFEIAVLARNNGFDVYIDGVFMKTLTQTAHFIGHIRYTSVLDFEDVIVRF